jgi:hypothetical protein
MTLKFDFGSLERPFEALWPVIVSVPQDGGGVREEEFTVKFRLLSKEEVKETDADRTDPGAALIRKAVIDVEGAEFTPELLEGLLGRGWTSLALQKAYAQFAMGIAEKN